MREKARPGLVLCPPPPHPFLPPTAQVSSVQLDRLGCEGPGTGGSRVPRFR